MFDLFRSRDKAVRYLLGALLMLVALSMVITLIPGYGTSSAPSDQLVARIGDEEITTREVQFRLQAELREKVNIPPSMLQHYVPQYINQMITERAIAYQAARMGFQVTDEELAKAIQSMLPGLTEGGFNKAAYASRLASMNLTIGEFEANVRKNLLLLKLQNLVLEGMVVTPQEVEAEYRRRNEKVKLEYVAFSPDKFRGQVTVTPQEIEAYYNTNKQSFQIGAKRSFDLVVADEAKVAATLTVSDAELQRMYVSRQESFRTPERVKIRHILLMTMDKPADEVKKREEKINDLLKQIKAGADFAELAKKHSEDPGSATRGGEMPDWVTRGQTVKNFEDTAFSLKKGELSGVIKTEYGFHILQQLDKEEAKLKPFAEVKDQLLAESKRQMVFDRLQNLAEQARNEIVKNPADAASVAQKLGLSFHRVENAGAGDPVQEVGILAELESALAGLQVNGVTPVIAAPSNKLAVAALRSITPARPAELKEVEAEIRGRLSSDKARQLMREKANEAAGRLKADDNLQAIAKQYGLNVLPVAEFGRDGAAEGIGSAALVSEAFTLPPGKTFGPVFVGDQAFLIKVTGKTEPDMQKLAEQRDEVVTAMKRRKASERKDLFEDGIVNHLIQEGKVKRYDDVIKRVAAGFQRG